MITPARILIVNPFGIGDVLFTTPLVRALRQAFPRSRLAYLCNQRTEYILRHNRNLDDVFIYEKDEFVRRWRASKRQGLAYLGRLLRQIRSGRFDLVVDLSLGERYGLILKLLGIRRRVGFHYRRRGRFLTESIAIDGYQDVHVVEYYRRLLSFMGIQLQDASLELRVAQEDERWAQQWLRQRRLENHRALVGIVPAGGVSWGIDAPFRRWSSEGFAHVGDALAARGVQTILFGEATDAPICQAVAERMTSAAIDVSGQTTLGQFISLLSRLRLVICNDGGPLHLAVSQRVRTVSVFGPVDPWVYGPYEPSGLRHRVVFRDDLPCRPCYHQFKLPPCPYERACLTTLGVDDVLAACLAALDDGA